MWIRFRLTRREKVYIDGDLFFDNGCWIQNDSSGVMPEAGLVRRRWRRTGVN
jgi:hypothetical protein